MSRVGLLLTYKLKSFFSPSYRGKYGPMLLIALSLVFLPSAVSMGYVVGGVLADADATLTINLLGSALSAAMVFGFVFALGVGVTAQPSELDFILTSPVRPREYLISDMLFLFGSITIAGGGAILMAVFGFLWGAEQPLVLAVPILLLVGAYAVMVFMIVQILTVLRIRYPGSPIRLVVMLLLLLSVVPIASIASADFPVGFTDLPIPQSAFAGMLNALMSESSVVFTDVAVAVGYLVVVFALWARVSGMYFFHGVKPTLTAGFGQVDMSSRMAQQKKMISGFGALTTKIRLRTESGSELSLLTRLNLIRFWRDGSFVFVALLLAVFLSTGILRSDSEESAPITINLAQAGAWPILVLAINWCFYERVNLWIPVVGGRSLETYFRGLMMAFAIVGLGIATVISVTLLLAGVALHMDDMALVLMAPIADAALVTAAITRVTVKPGAFSAGATLILAAMVILGGVVGVGVSAAVRMIGDSTATLVAAQLAITAMLSVAVSVIGLVAVTRLARGFKYS